MIFPKGEVRHRDLFTAYTNLPALLSTLKSEKFSGTVEVEFPDNRGLLFIISGQVANAEAKRRSNQRRLTGPEAVRSLLALSDRKDGTINVYRWPSDKVAMMANNLEHEILFKGLSTDFTHLDRLILNLREAKHDGFSEIQTAVQGDAITCNANSLGCMFWGNQAFDAGAAPAQNPVLDSGANDWGVNWTGDAVTYPV